MSSSIPGLPPVPPELKAIIPYLQRANELEKQDPIISYWCTYYAAQIGISLKARSAPARDLLLAVLGVLEQLKSDIGPTDAIDIESVSSAYVENFALKVFSNADNEDRSARATRSTAKKFLAAANFLEILKTFPKSDISESTEDKIRYAKWKASDIAKAYREERKPIPGPPGWAEEQEELNQFHAQGDTHAPLPPSSRPEFILPQSSPHAGTAGTSPLYSSHTPAASPSKRSPNSNSPPKLDHNLFTDRSPNFDGPPESWSTVATPGTEHPVVYSIGTPSPSTAGYEQDHHSPTNSISHQRRTGDIRTKPRSGSGSSSNTVSSNGGKGVSKNSAWSSEEIGVNHTPSSSPPKSSFKSGSPDSDKKVHFSPSVAGSPPPPPPPLLPHSGSPKEYLGPSSIYAPPQLPISPTFISPSHSHPTYPSATSAPSLSSTVAPPMNYIYGPNPPSQTSPTGNSTRSHSSISSAAVTHTAVVELTPGIIGKAQKHCRYAISALDYEDAEQAKKELRAALALLGG